MSSDGSRGRSALRTYLAPVILSIGFLVLSPLGLLVIFLSGDSCCGENTTGTMVAVTAGLVVLIAAVSLLLAAAIKLAVKRPDFSVPVAWAVMAAPASVLYVAFVTFISITAF